MKRSGPLSSRHIRSDLSNKNHQDSNDLDDLFSQAMLAYKKKEESQSLTSSSNLSTDSLQKEEVDYSDEEEEPEDINPRENNKTSQDHMRCQFRKNVEKGIKADLIKLGIASEVIEIADQYYHEVTKGEIKRREIYLSI